MCTNSTDEKTAVRWLFSNFWPSPNRIVLLNANPPHELGLIDEPTREEIETELTRESSERRFYTGDPARVRIIEIEPWSQPKTATMWIYSHLFGDAPHVILWGDDGSSAAIFEPTPEEIETCRGATPEAFIQYTGDLDRLLIFSKEGESE
jgi:hypothetical protein